MSSTFHTIIRSNLKIYEEKDANRNLPNYHGNPRNHKVRFQECAPKIEASLLSHYLLSKPTPFLSTACSTAEEVLELKLVQSCSPQEFPDLLQVLETI